MPDSKSEISDDAFSHIWMCIKDELASLQEKAPNEQRGQVVNPISGAVYAQNTGAAALVFAADYVRTGSPDSLSRARLALEGLLKINIYSGLDEPKWSRLGWHNYKGSMFATGTLLDALWKAQALLQIGNDKQDFQPLLRYLETCKISKGLYTHDTFKPGQTPIPVQNTTAIALYLMEFVSSQAGDPGGELRSECDSIAESLGKGQRPDGLWPYTYPLPFQRMAFYFPAAWPFFGRLPIIRRYLLGAGDTSILFGDMVHHCLVLYYLAKSASLRPQSQGGYKHTVSKGWGWLRDHLINVGNGELKVDFSWEPAPTCFRYANFSDTSTYFLILAMLPFLVELGVISIADYHKFSSGVLMHVEQCLLNAKDCPTTIKPYEGPDEILKYILPRVGEASAWKGALLSEFISNHAKIKG